MTGMSAQSFPAQLGAFGKVIDQAKKRGRGMAKLYELEEQVFKMAKFVHNIERKGMDFAKAAKDAEKWLFNYSKVTKFQDKYRSKWYGAPFATFTFKALPRIAEAAVKTPWRFALPAAMIYQLEKTARDMIGDTREQAEAKRELTPEWMNKKKFLGIMPSFARFPFVDDYGREHYLNLSYILPWGDIAEGGDFAGIPGSLRPISQPFANEFLQQAANYDFFWKDKIVKDEETAGKSFMGKAAENLEMRGKHVFRSLAPTPLLDLEKAYAARKGEHDYKGRLRSKGVVAADALLGVKLYPVDYTEELVRAIHKQDPSKGLLAIKIKGQIKTFAVKKQIGRAHV
jgi:hypothetical protein